MRQPKCQVQEKAWKTRKITPCSFTVDLSVSKTELLPVSVSTQCSHLKAACWCAVLFVCFCFALHKPVFIKSSFYKRRPLFCRNGLTKLTYLYPYTFTSGCCPVQRLKIVDISEQIQHSSKSYGATETKPYTVISNVNLKKYFWYFVAF